MVAIAVMVVLSVFFICLAVSDYAKYKYGNTSENDCEMCPYKKECEEMLIKVNSDSFHETKTYKIENIGQGKFYIYGEPKRLTRKEYLEKARRMTIDD